MTSHLRVAFLASACLLACGGAALAASANGVAGAMPAYYDGQLFLINFKELSAAAEQAVLASNQSVNTIFTSEASLPGGAPFVAVLDAIQGDGFNPLWLEMEITFRPGVTPYQITRDDDVTAAVARGDIDLSSAGEVYRCAVIGAATVAGTGGGPAGATANIPGGTAAGAAGSENGSAGDMPVWLEVQVTFNPGVTPHQLARDDDVLDAQARGEITLSSSGEVYRCAVVGAKN